MNILLLGCKGSGKSTVGALLARLAGRDFLDTDRLLEQLFLERQGKALTCREIYATCGKAVMRQLEAEVLGALPATGKAVIATGGGVVLEKANLPLLARAGLRVFLDVPLFVLQKRLADQQDSPLFQDSDLSSLYAERYPLYCAACDVRHAVQARWSPEETARSLHELLRLSVQAEKP